MALIILERADGVLPMYVCAHLPLHIWQLAQKRVLRVVQYVLPLN